MKMLITSRSFGDSKEAMSILEEAGYEVTRYYTTERPLFDPEIFAQMIPDYDALVIGAEDFPVNLMRRCSNLKIILKPGTGVNNIHIPEAAAQGIKVVAAPGVNAQAVADLTFGLILACARKICIGYGDVRNGMWSKNKAMLTGTDVWRKTVGILGFGNIGKSVAKRAHVFDMTVLSYDPYIAEVPEDFAEFVSLESNVEAVAARADFLCIHLPLTPETNGMIDRRIMGQMKRGAVIINTSRGGIVNEADLYDAICSGHLSGAGLDVTEDEPIRPDSPLLTLPQVIITPHIASYSREASQAVMITTAENAARFARGEEIEARFIMKG